MCGAYTFISCNERLRFMNIVPDMWVLKKGSKWEQFIWTLLKTCASKEKKEKRKKRKTKIHIQYYSY